MKSRRNQAEESERPPATPHEAAWLALRERCCSSGRKAKAVVMLRQADLRVAVDAALAFAAKNPLAVPGSSPNGCRSETDSKAPAQ